MTTKIDNLGMCSIGKYYALNTSSGWYPVTCLIAAEAFSLDALEDKLKKWGQPLKLVGFWIPTGDYAYVRAILDTSEVPVEVNPFMRMSIFLSKMDARANQVWAEELEREYKEALKAMEESDKQAALDAANPQRVVVRRRIAVLQGERNILLNRRQSCLYDKPFGTCDNGSLLKVVDDRLQKIKEELLTLNAVSVG